MIHIRDSLKDITRLVEDLEKEEFSTIVKIKREKFEKLRNVKGSKGCILPGSGFTKWMTEFVGTCQIFYSKYDTLFKSAEKEFESAVVLYGEEVKTMTPDEFFGMFSKFVQSYQAAKFDNEAEVLREIEAKKKEADKRVNLDEGIYFYNLIVY